ncbi:MAG: DUF4112 domain-containing protein [Opitutales bacterium]
MERADRNGVDNAHAIEPAGPSSHAAPQFPSHADAEGAARYPTDAQLQTLRHIESVAKLFDSAIKVPGIGGVGLDSLVGMFFGAGDLVMGVASSYLIVRAKQLGLPRHKLRQMMRNAALDTAFGFVPLVGDAFDFFYKSNIRNLNIVREHFGLAATGFDAAETEIRRRAQQADRQLPTEEPGRAEAMPGVEKTQLAATPGGGRAHYRLELAGGSREVTAIMGVLAPLTGDDGAPTGGVRFVTGTPEALSIDIFDGQLSAEAGQPATAVFLRDGKMDTLIGICNHATGEDRRFSEDIGLILLSPKRIAAALAWGLLAGGVGAAFGALLPAVAWLSAFYAVSVAVTLSSYLLFSAVASMRGSRKLRALLSEIYREQAALLRAKTAVRG